MATERLLIEIDEKGARVVKRNIDEIGGAAKGASAGVGLLQRSLLGIGVAALAREIIKLADASTILQNKIRSATSTDEEFAAAQERLLAISNRTRTSLEANADAFDKLRLTTRDLGLTQDQTLDLLEDINLIMKVSGASGSEAASGVRQLAVAFQQGSLSGLELRALLRQFPEVFDLIARRLGVTTAGLQTLGKDGQISGQLLVQAFAESRTELEERFGKVVPTIGEQFGVLKNSILDFVGAINEANTSGGKLLSTIESISLALQQMADGIRQSGFRGFVESFFVGFEQLQEVEAEAARINKLLLEQQKRRAAGAPEEEVVRGFDVPVAPPTGPTAAQIDAANKFAEAQRDINAELDREFRLAGLSSREREVQMQLRQTENALIKAGVDVRSKEAQTQLDIAEGIIRNTQAISEQQAVLEEITGPEEDRIRRMDILRTLLADGKINQDQFTEAVRKLNEELAGTGTVLEALNQKFASMDLSAKALALSVGDILVGAVDSLSGAVADFAISGFRDFESFKENLSNILRDIAKEIIKLIIKFLILKAIQAGLGAVGGGAGESTSATTAGTGSAVGTNLSGGLQAGGPATAGRSFLVGERGPEVFTPTRSGTVSPDLGAAVRPEVSIQVVNVTDPDEVRSALSTAEGEQVILNIIQKHGREVAQMTGGGR